MSSQSLANCSTCGKPATRPCAGCKTHVYCDEGCQAREWLKHKSVCKDIRKDIKLENQIERAAKFVQEAYLQFRENTFDNEVIRIEHKEGELVMYDGNNSREKGWFVKFPHHLVKDEYTKMTILTAWACAEPLAYMHQTVARLFEGFKIKIEEITVTLKDLPLKATAVRADGFRNTNWPAYSHEIFLLTSIKTGRQWAVDVTGGQHGLFQACWDWEEYKRRYIVKVNRAYVLGAHKQYIDQVGMIDGNPSCIYGLGSMAADELDTAVQSWSLKQNVKLSDLLKFSDDIFLEQRREVLNIMSYAVSDFVRTADTTTMVQKRAEFEAAQPGLSQQRSEVLARMFTEAGSTFV